MFSSDDKMAEQLNKLRASDPTTGIERILRSNCFPFFAILVLLLAFHFFNQVHKLSTHPSLWAMMSCDTCSKLLAMWCICHIQQRVHIPWLTWLAQLECRAASD
jgi:hypothetical protein